MHHVAHGNITKVNGTHNMSVWDHINNILTSE